MSGQPGSPRVKATWHLAKVKPALGENKDVQAVDAELNLTVADGLGKAKFGIKGWGPEPVRAEVSLPMKLALKPFVVDVPSSGRLRGKLAADLDLALIPRMLALDDQRIAGQARLDLALSGTLDEPKLTGRVKISDGRYESVKIGAVVKDVRADLAADGPRIRLIDLAATDGENGRISARGMIDLDPKKRFPFQVKLDLEKARVVRLDLLQATCSGAIAFKGRTSDAALSGEIIVEQGEANLPESMPPTVVDLEVTEINTDKPIEPVERSASEKRFKLGLNLGLKWPGRFFVRGQGLESEWKGELKIAGEASTPKIRGGLAVVRGRYEFLDQRFKLTNGTIAFNGSTPPSPMVDITGETELDDITATMKITGLAQNPKIDLSSDPSLPSDEILARVLFGKALNQITPLQALSLAQAAKKLTMGGGGDSGFDPLKTTRKMLGVDSLDVKKGEEGGTTLGVGKYLSEKVYVEAETGTDPGSDKITIELELSPNMSLESEIGSDSTGGVGINWKRDY